MYRYLLLSLSLIIFIPSDASAGCRDGEGDVPCSNSNVDPPVNHLAPHQFGNHPVMADGLFVDVQGNVVFVTGWKDIQDANGIARNWHCIGTVEVYHRVIFEGIDYGYAKGNMLCSDHGAYFNYIITLDDVYHPPMI